MEYSNKIILITGASSGMGRATAMALAKYRNKMIITARRQSLLREVAEEVRRAGSECTYFVGDATDAAHSDLVVSEMIKKYGRIDFALLNVGIGPASNTLTASREKILFCMRTNYDSMINFFVPLIAQMKKQNTPCMISHMNSQATYFGIPMQGDYTAAKGAARLFIETARMELQHFGITHIKLQTIHPGFVATHAVQDDGIPAPNEISEEEAAKYVLKGIQKEVRENLFPPGTAFATRIGRISPLWLKTKILLASIPKRY